MTLLRLHRTLPALFLVLFMCASPSSAANRPLDRLVLNDGERLRINLVSASEDVLIITHGRARRAAQTAKSGESAENIISKTELDIVGREVSLKTNARQILISGAMTADIAGVAASDWGDVETPAVFIDRDCRVTLKGKAVRSAVVEVHPLAIATVDARQLETKEIIIVGNATTNVLRRQGTKVSFLERERAPVTRTSGNAENWATTPDIAPPAAAPASPPASAPAAPQAAPGQEIPPASE